MRHHLFWGAVVAVKSPPGGGSNKFNFEVCSPCSTRPLAPAPRRGGGPHAPEVGRAGLSREARHLRLPWGSRRRRSLAGPKDANITPAEPAPGRASGRKGAPAPAPGPSESRLEPRSFVRARPRREGKLRLRAPAPILLVPAALCGTIAAPRSLHIGGGGPNPEGPCACAVREFRLPAVELDMQRASG